MEMLRASYGGNSSSDSDNAVSSPPPPPRRLGKVTPPPLPSLPPPPISLLTPPNSLDHSLIAKPQTQPTRVRSFAHVDGNYALHVYIPVSISAPQRKEISLFVKRVASAVPGLFVVDVDVPLEPLCRDDQKLEQVAMGREFHISLGRTVPIRVHQIDSVVSMLRQKLQLHKPYWIDFSKWQVFLNDDRTRTFFSIEVLGQGLREITKQIQLVNEVYRLHNLPEFYKDPRPHISLAWALGDVTENLEEVIQGEMKRDANLRKRSTNCIFTCRFGGIECKIGKKTYTVCKLPED